MDEQKIRQLFKNRSNCYADSQDVIQAVDEDMFVKLFFELIEQSDKSDYVVQPKASPKCQSDCVNALKGTRSKECMSCIRNVIFQDNYKSDCHFA